MTRDRKWLTPAALKDALSIRVKACGSQRTLAREIGVSEPYLSDVLNGRREPGAKLLEGLGYRRVVVYETLDRRR